MGTHMLVKTHLWSGRGILLVLWRWYDQMPTPKGDFKLLGYGTCGGHTTRDCDIGGTTCCDLEWIWYLTPCLWCSIWGLTREETHLLVMTQSTIVVIVIWLTRHTMNSPFLLPLQSRYVWQGTRWISPSLTMLDICSLSCQRTPLSWYSRVVHLGHPKLSMDHQETLSRQIEVIECGRRGWV